MKPSFKSIACILGLAAISATPLRAQAAKHYIVDTAAAGLVDTLKEQAGSPWKAR